MKNFAILLLLLSSVILHAQSDRKMIRQGYKAYMDGNFNDAEVDFRKAEDINKESFTAKYNTSTALYQQEKIDESVQRFEELLAETTDDKDEAKLYHNLGNSFLETDKLQESIEAYKKSLRLNPSDEDTRYNLAYALEKLQEQEQQQDQENQDNKENKENKDDQQEQDDKNKEQQDKQDQNEENEDQESGDQNKEGDHEQNQPQPQQLSKEDAERLLNAILQKEKDVKEKVDKKKAAAAKIKTDKDW